MPGISWARPRAPTGERAAACQRLSCQTSASISAGERSNRRGELVHLGGIKRRDHAGVARGIGDRPRRHRKICRQLDNVGVEVSRFGGRGRCQRTRNPARAGRVDLQDIGARGHGGAQQHRTNRSARAGKNHRENSVRIPRLH